MLFPDSYKFYQFLGGESPEINFIARSRTNLLQAFNYTPLVHHRTHAWRYVVENKRFRLQDASCKGKWVDLDRRLPFKEAFAPGKYIVMTVIFQHDPGMDRECPRCGGTEGVITESSKILWFVTWTRYTRVPYIANNTNQ